MTRSAIDTPTAVLELSELSLPGWVEATLSVPPGELAVVLTAKEEMSALLSRMIVGLQPSRGGSIALFGNDTTRYGPKEWQLVRQRIGLLQGLGGLVSNLKVWENLTLPLYYHRQPPREEVEALGIRLLERVGYTGRYMELPGHLTLYQKKQVGLCRALIMDPELVIYESPEQGLTYEEKELFFRLIREFHAERPGRVSLILSCQHESAAELAGARTLELKGHLV